MLKIVRIEVKWSKIVRKCSKSRKILKITQNAGNHQNRAQMVKIDQKCSKSRKIIKISQNASKSSKSSSNGQNRPKMLQNHQNQAQILQNHVKPSGFRQKRPPPPGPACLLNLSKSLQIHQNLTNPPRPRQNRSNVLQTPPNRAQIPFKPSQIAKFWQSDSLPLPRLLTQNSTWMGSHGERSCGVRSGFVK